MLSRPVNSDEYLGGEGCINLVCQQACERVASILYPQARLPWSPFYHLFFLIFQTTTPTEVWPWRLFVYFIFSHCERPVLLWDPFHILQTLYYTFVSYSSNTLLHIVFWSTCNMCSSITVADNSEENQTSKHLSLTLGRIIQTSHTIRTSASLVPLTDVTSYIQLLFIINFPYQHKGINLPFWFKHFQKQKMYIWHLI